jgi:hypothetical protein
VIVLVVVVLTCTTVVVDVVSISVAVSVWGGAFRRTEIQYGVAAAPSAWMELTSEETLDCWHTPLPWGPPAGTGVADTARTSDATAITQADFILTSRD